MVTGRINSIGYNYYYIYNSQALYPLGAKE